MIVTCTSNTFQPVTLTIYIESAQELGVLQNMLNNPPQVAVEDQAVLTALVTNISDSLKNKTTIGTVQTP